MRTLAVPPEGIHQGPLILVNRRFPVRGEAPALAYVAEGIQLEREAAQALRGLLGAVGAGGAITAVSGWRSMAEQERIYTQSLADSGAAFTQQFVALPGHSEHQTGLAIDLGLTQEDLDFICPAFPYHGICQDLRNRAADFGFVERYPAGKEAVTGIAHEPWHFRYVGLPHAALMAQRGWTLEEYHEAVKRHPLGGEPLRWKAGAVEYRVVYIPAQQGRALRLEDGEAYTLSGDNESGYVLTTWREGGISCGNG